MNLNYPELLRNAIGENMTSDEDEKSIRARFISQRRNLVFVSIFLMSYVYLNLHFTVINILGNKFTIHDSVRVEHLIIVAFIYFLCRYYQYYTATNKREFLHFYNSQMGYLLKPYVQSARVKEIPNIYIDNPNYRSLKSVESITNIEFSGCQAVRIPPIYPRFFTDTEYTVILEADIYFVDENGEHHVVRVHDNSFTYSDPRVVYAKLYSFIYMCLKTPYFTEYLLPFVVAFITPIIVWIFM